MLSLHDFPPSVKELKIRELKNNFLEPVEKLGGSKHQIIGDMINNEQLVSRSFYWLQCDPFCILQH